ncbi:hypothetical protein HD806DRAFT_519270 [Xylariaceae sp. AK1471]|nr:hypothetical protein HD806DRAFT_519270 [Xylariaceae sp. AK1471]
MLHRGITSPQRPGHQLRRSITEQSPPFKHSRVHQYLHRKDRDRDDRLPLSASQPVRGSLDLPRAEAVTPGTTTDLRSNMVLWAGDDIPNASEAVTKSQWSLGKDRIAREQKGKVAAAAASIRKSLLDLNNFSNAQIVRLDEAYSVVLQRRGSLQSTILAIKDLADMSYEMDGSFRSESLALVSEIESQLSVYDQSEDQKKCIQDLKARIHAGRDKVQALSKRVDVVRERIEGWERADKEWQERTRKRLKVLWIIISVMALVLVSLFVGVQYASSSVDINKLAELTPDTPQGRPPMASLIGNTNNSKSAATLADEVRAELTRRRGHGAPDQEALRVFDEL